jgi:hypothetical protein
VRGRQARGSQAVAALASAARQPCVRAAAWPRCTSHPRYLSNLEPDELDQELVEAAKEAAREEGERVVKTMTLDELVALIHGDQPGADDVVVDTDDDQGADEGRGEAALLGVHGLAPAAARVGHCVHQRLPGAGPVWRVGADREGPGAVAGAPKSRA